MGEKFKSVAAFMSKDNKDKYMIVFNECIYNDYRDGMALYRISNDLLQPEVDGGFAGLTDMSGYFIKDKITVYTCWHSCYDYFWEVYTNDEEIKQKVFEWAVMVNNEYLKLKKE